MKKFSTLKELFSEIYKDSGKAHIQTGTYRIDGRLVAHSAFNGQKSESWVIDQLFSDDYETITSVHPIDRLEEITSLEKVRLITKVNAPTGEMVHKKDKKFIGRGTYKVLVPVTKDYYITPGVYNIDDYYDGEDENTFVLVRRRISE